jgi:hypothetical protein
MDQILGLCHYLEENRHFELTLNVLMGSLQDLCQSFKQLIDRSKWIGWILETFSSFSIKCLVLFYETVRLIRTLHSFLFMNGLLQVIQLHALEPLGYFALSITVSDMHFLEGLKVKKKKNCFSHLDKYDII